MSYTESVYMRIHRILTWKRVIAFNLLLILVLVVPFSLRLAQEDTENRSGASNEEEVIQEPPPNYPSQPPVIERVKSFYGKTGDSVVVLGQNFGEYQWASQVNVGNTVVPKDDVVSWSDNVIEVQIPESARSGDVMVVVNGAQARWDGRLFVYDEASAAEVGIRKLETGQGRIYLGRGTSVARGMIEIAYTSDPIDITAASGVEVVSVSNSVDSLGKKVRVEFAINQPLSRANTDILNVSYSGVGNLELYRVELFSGSSTLIEVYSLPLSVNVGL